MRKQITNISPLQSAKVLAVLYFAISLPLLLLMLAMPGPKPPYVSGSMLALPFFYALFGFLFTLFGAWVYNFVAKHLGGIEFTTQNVEEA
ncbi:MAG: hypothetical protein ACYCY7_11270 [Gallionella sp.]|uniref:Uncharacterized protein n=1 Tax=Candidatus Gallionella acididurans TaxID=1796491 RepID=A0A139BTZ8_9PROT|nr:MAG: Uncharacterized protein AWT59_1521 [Candidatus Gallionella acididurans]